MTQPQPVRSPWTEDGCLATVPANDNRPILPPLIDKSSDMYRGVAPVRHVPRMPAGPAPGVRQPLSFEHLPRVIALAGAAGSGKSTVSDFLAGRYGYGRSKFAAPLKDMCRALGMTEAMIEGDQKELPVDWLCGRSPRYAMQHLGQSWGRACMGEDFWVDLWQHSTAGQRVIVDDARYANEAARVRQMGGKVIRLVGRGGIAGNHASEQVNFIADEVIENIGTIAELQARVAEVVEGWRVE